MSAPVGLHGQEVRAAQRVGPLGAVPVGPGKLSEDIITGACLCPWFGVYTRGICVHVCDREGWLRAGEDFLS